MTIKKIFFILVIANIGLLKAQYTAIPDTCFEFHLIDQGIDSEGLEDGQILTSDIENITQLILDGTHPDIVCNIMDLTGIQDFTMLETLECTYQNIINMDLTGLTNLKVLVCSNNEMETLNITNNPNLEVIFCATNNLTSLDVSQNGMLRELFAFQNQISSIDISNNLQIETINLSFNQLSNFISANNTLLNSLSLGVNQLTNININDLTNLILFACSHNNLDNINTNNNSILEIFNCSDNNFTSLNTDNNLNLKVLFCKNNNLTTLNLENNINLEELYCFENNLTGLNLKNNVLLKKLQCFNNLLTNLDIRNSSNLILEIFSATNNPNLTCIYVDNATYSTENWLDIDETTTFVETEAECETLSINDLKLNDVIFYPNPIKGFLQIKNVNNQNIKEIILYNILGKKIIKTNNTFIDFSKFEKGVYFIELIMKNNKTLAKKIIKV